MSSSIENLMERVDWHATGMTAPPEPRVAYATHQGELKIGDFTFRCYRLNTGEAILDAEDVRRFFGDVDLLPTFRTFHTHAPQEG